MQLSVTFCCLCLIATCAMAVGPLSSYSVPTFKATLATDIGPGMIYADATKKIVRVDMSTPYFNPSSKKITHGIEFYMEHKYLVMTWKLGNSSSLKCTYTDLRSFPNMFYDLLEGATYQGLKALNNTVGYAYELALFNVFQEHLSLTVSPCCLLSLLLVFLSMELSHLLMLHQ